MTWGGEGIKRCLKSEINELDSKHAPTKPNNVASILLVSPTISSTSFQTLLLFSSAHPNPLQFTIIYIFPKPNITNFIISRFPTHLHILYTLNYFHLKTSTPQPLFFFFSSLDLMKWNLWFTMNILALVTFRVWKLFIIIIYIFNKNL